MKDSGDYISRQAFLDAIESGKKYHQDADDIAEMLQNWPDADVRPVVLCRDCVHYEMGACLKIYDDGAANKDAWQERKPEDFCSYGERRDES